MSDPGEEQALREYLISAGGFVHEGLSLLTHDAVKGRKVFCNVSVAKGTELLKVPVNICFFQSPTRPAEQVRAAKCRISSFAGLLLAADRFRSTNEPS